MKVENGVRVFAGIMILISAMLAWLVSEWWLLFTVFISINLTHTNLYFLLVEIRSADERRFSQMVRVFILRPSARICG